MLTGFQLLNSAECLLERAKNRIAPVSLVQFRDGAAFERSIMWVPH